MLILQNEYCGLINCCSGKPIAPKDKVEGFIPQNGLDISLEYDVFTERKYDSSVVYGDNTIIRKLIKRNNG